MSTSETVFEIPTTDGSLGENEGLSTSNTSNLSTCFPDSPIHQSTPTITIDEVEATLEEGKTSLTYKQHYFKVCMRGESPSSAYGTQDMSYGTSGITGYSSRPPDYEDIFVEGEAANAGANGSTVSRSGLGPNVSTNPAIMVDVKPNAIQPSPKSSSTKMTPSSTDIPTKFSLGASPASDIGDELAKPAGQSSPVSPT